MALRLADDGTLAPYRQQDATQIKAALQATLPHLLSWLGYHEYNRLNPESPSHKTDSEWQIKELEPVITQVRDALKLLA